MSSEVTVSRRKFIAAATSVTATGLAGCSSSGDASRETTNEPADTATESEETDSATESEETDSATESVTGTETYNNGVGADASISFDVPSSTKELTSKYVQWKATANGVTIEESGAVNEGAGHYHILVDTEPVTPGEVIPSDGAHVHYGTGQTNGVLELEPGEHTLHLQVADGEHRAMDLTDTVEVTVTEAANLSLDTAVDGSVVDWEVTAENYTVEPSNEGINSNSGHLHAIIDSDHVPVGEVIPGDETHVHFGDGSTSGSLDLAEQLGNAYEPGEHKIHFQIGTGTHRATMVHTHTTVTTE